MKKSNTRREYYIYREIQFKYIRLTLLLMLLVCIIMGYTVSETSLGVLTKTLSKVYPAEGIKEVYGILNSTLILRLLLMIPVIIVAAMYVSHRIAGPVYRLEKELIQIGEGDLSRRLVLRKNDDLKKMANEMNNVMDRLDNHFSLIKSHIAILEDSLKQVKREGIKEENLKPVIDKWDDTLEKISKELAYFKTSA